MIVTSTGSLPCGWAWLCMNPLPDNKILALSKLEAFAANNVNVAQLVQIFSDRVENILGKGENAQLVQFISDWVENIVGKGENAGYQHFLPLPQCVLKLFLLESLKNGLV